MSALRHFLFVALALFGAMAAPSIIVADESRPNFLVILCDDLGYGDLGCYGNETIQTPHLDALASQGIRLTDCYSASPLCSPARCGLLTGRTPSRFGVYSWIPGGHVMHLPESETTIATLLRDSGYDTCQVGKWHCNGLFNNDSQPQPGDHGFDHWFATQNNASPTHHNPQNFVRNGEPVGRLEGYSCQLVADEAIAWLGEARDENDPFFLFVCFHEPHEPIDSPPELVEQYPDATARGEALYYANVTNMDLAVGRLMETLDAMDLADDTFVIFTSDNGPETLNRYSSAWRSHGTPGPLRGMKLWMYDGGFRVPGIIRFPGATQAGTVVDEPVCSLDLLPTLCEMASVELPEDITLDGTSFTPIFAGEKIKRETPLFWHFYRALGRPKVALRDGDWMVLGILDWPTDGTSGGAFREAEMQRLKESQIVEVEIYNVREDIAQENNLAESEPEQLERLSRLLSEKWNDVRSEAPVWDFGG